MNMLSNDKLYITEEKIIILFEDLYIFFLKIWLTWNQFRQNDFSKQIKHGEEEGEEIQKPAIVKLLKKKLENVQSKRVAKKEEKGE